MHRANFLKRPRCLGRLILFTVMVILVCVPRLSHSAEKSNPKDNPIKKEAPSNPKENLIKKEAPLHIASDRMEANQKENVISFEGHVLAQQEDLTISGKLLKIYTTKKSKGAQSDVTDRVDRIEIEGDVSITQKDRVATASKAIYYQEDQKIVLMGQPRVSQGQDTIQGRLITLYLAEERSVVEGGEQTPVQAVFHPGRGK